MSILQYMFNIQYTLHFCKLLSVIKTALYFLNQYFTSLRGISLVALFHLAISKLQKYLLQIILIVEKFAVIVSLNVFKFHFVNFYRWRLKRCLYSMSRYSLLVLVFSGCASLLISLTQYFIFFPYNFYLLVQQNYSEHV